MATDSPSKASVDEAHNNDLSADEETRSSIAPSTGTARTSRSVADGNNQIDDDLREDIICKRNASSSFRIESSFLSQLVDVAVAPNLDEKIAQAVRLSAVSESNLPGAYDSETNIRAASSTNSTNNNRKLSQGQLIELVQLETTHKEREQQTDRGLEECRADTCDPIDDLQERMNAFDANVTSQTAEQDEEKLIRRERTRDKRKLIIAALTLVVLVGASFGVVLGISGRSTAITSYDVESEDTNAILRHFDDLFLNPCANASSSTFNNMSKRFVQLHSRIATRLFSGNEMMSTAIDTPLSKERLALCWLSDLDKLHRGDNIFMTKEESEDGIIQRFLLATVYFHFFHASKLADAGTANLAIDAGWLARTKHECDWDYVICDKATNRRVERLELTNFQLVGQVPSELCLLTNLVSLDLSVNDLSGSIPSKLGSMTRLTRLALHTNQLSGAIFENIRRLEKLNELYIAHNLFTGTMPAIWNMTKMTALSMGYNGFEGTLSDLSASTKLVALDLSGLALIGTVPAGFWTLTQLEMLSMAGTSLSGTIPTEIGQLDELRSLNLAGGSFSGTIPSEMGQLNHIERVELHNNKFTGTVQEEICSLVEDALTFLKVDSQVACACCSKRSRAMHLT